MSGGKGVRNKGRDGESAFCRLLCSRDWTVETREGAGRNREDRIVCDPKGIRYALEVKTQKILNICAWKAQAVSQASRRKLPWMLAMKIFGSSCWLVLRQAEDPVVWKEGVSPS